MTGFRRLIGAHWKTLSLIVVVVLALSSGVYAYWINNMPMSSPPTSTFTSYPLELRMELEKTEFQEGELIEVHAFIRNISNRTVQITTWKKWLDFKIADENGTVVYRWASRMGFFGYGTPYILKPGAEFNSTQKSEVIDEKTVSMVPLQLSKGTYKIIEFIHPDSVTVAYLEPYEKIGELALETPPITITIT